MTSSALLVLSGIQNTNSVCIQITVSAYLFPLEDEIHGNKLHQGQRGLKMQFIILDYLFIMFLTEGILLHMFGQRGF